MSVFAFHLRSCLRYSEHEGSVCRQKGQRRANGEKKKKQHKRAPIDLFFSIWATQHNKEKKQTWKPFVDFISSETSIHSASTRFVTF